MCEVGWSGPSLGALLRAGHCHQCWGLSPSTAVPLHVPEETEGGQTSRSDEVPDVFRGCLPPRSLPSAWRDRQLPRRSPNSSLPGKKSPAEHKRGNQFAAQSKLGWEEGSELQARSVLQRVVFEPFPLQAAGSAACAEEVTGRFPASQRRWWPVWE